MKKQIGLVVLMVVALLAGSLLAGCVGKEETKEIEEEKLEKIKEGWKRQENKDFGFRIDYIEDWGYHVMVNVTKVNHSSVSFTPPHQMESKETQMCFSVSIYESFNKTLDEWTKEKIEDIESHPKIASLEEFSNTTLDDIPAIKIISTTILFRKPRGKTLYIYAIKENIGYSLEFYGFTLEAYNKHIELANQMINSFRFI
jgi:hypothetical protein